MMRISFRVTQTAVLSAVALTTVLITIVHSEGAGRYLGEVVARWEPDGRTMTLVEPFQYIDRHDRKWSVPRGIAVDGASIPQVFWSVIGGPFEGRYRNASVIHDYYCDAKSRSWQDVHLVFYEAMLASGVKAPTAYLMYKAVEQFGPRWSEPQIKPECRRSDGGFDYKKCTDNNGYTQPSTTWPSSTRAELQSFIDEVAPKSDPADIARLRQSIRP